MNNKTQMAAAIGAGYLLGRTRRMKLALMLAGAGTTGRFRGGPRELLTLGTKMLANSPEVAKLGDTVRGELLGAAKAAAVTAASQRIDSLSNRLQSGGQEITGTVSDAADNVTDVTKVSKFGRKKHTRSRDDDEQPSTDEPPEDNSAGEEDAADEEPAPRKRPTPRRRAGATGSTRPASRSRTAKSDEDDDNEESPARKRRTRAKATTDSAPVRRARR
ncbi:hypothetical protein [Rhodococcus opacus]|uniref:DNA primase n=1 Tax=Rhodococcus opacus TaxID=37919 RepID=A0A076EIR5_RHOOP|nr:hypothetical protein [Rhodococcus opacus]AII03374.1 hypothetical protein EP51_01435 [Rhodococcus opacus]